MLLFLASCEPSTLSDLRCEGEAETRKLAQELELIETKDDLLRALPKLKKRFNRLADLLVQAKSFQAEEIEPSIASEQLFAEMARLYEIQGCRELIEQSQMEAVKRLR